MHCIAYSYVTARSAVLRTLMVRPTCFQRNDCNALIRSAFRMHVLESFVSKHGWTLKGPLND